jgi:hypothetical protein
VLADIKRAGGTVAGYKCTFASEGLRVVVFVCDSNGRHPEIEKMQKVADWPPCRPVTEAKVFIGLCVYSRTWIPKFSLIVDPIFDTFCLKQHKDKERINKMDGKGKEEGKGIKGAVRKEEEEFRWGKEQQQAMDKLKKALVTAPALRPLIYKGHTVGIIVLGVEASLLVYGAILQQEDSAGKRHPCRYESGLWSEAEWRYDAGKLECCALVRMLKEFGHHYGIHFLIEIDAKTLIYQLNRLVNDIPGAVARRWLAYIRLLSLDIQHVVGTKPKGPDALSRRPATEVEEEQRRKGAQHDEELDVFMNGELDRLEWAESGEYRGARMGLQSPEYLTIVHAANRDSGNVQRICEYLLTLRRPHGITEVDFKRLRNEAVKYMMEGTILYRRGKPGMPPRKVVQKDAEEQRILKELHDESRHRGQDATYQRVNTQFYSKGLYVDVERYTQSYERCQKRRVNRFDEPLHKTFSYGLWMKASLDVVHMPTASDGNRYMVEMRDDLSGWSEYKPLRKADSRAVGKFVYET